MGTFERSAITMPVEGKKKVEREGIALDETIGDREFKFSISFDGDRLYSIFNAIAVIQMRKETIDSLIWVTYKDSKIVLSNGK